MNFFNCWLFLCIVSLTQAYRSSRMYNADYAADYCILGNTPVCGTNGHEYFRLDNECELIKFNRKQLEKGQLALSKTSLDFCNPPPLSLAYSQPSLKPYCPQYCNKIPRPICASFRNEQRNFTNVCELKKHICDTKENWQIILNDTCITVSCPLDGQEICASLDGNTQTFPNLLSLYVDIQATGKNWEILNVGPCPCPEDYRPICAQLNCTAKTFTNECFLEREIKNGSLWTLLFYGECPELPTPNPNLPANANDDEADIDEGVESGDGPLDLDAVIDSTLNEIKEANKKKAAAKPVYIVKNNKISPLMPLVYPNPDPPKPIDYYPLYEAAKAYKESYDKPYKKVYEKVPKPLYEEPPAKMYSKNVYNYAANTNPPDYQSFFKPLKASYTASAVAVASSSYNHDYYAPKTVTDYRYPDEYKPMNLGYDKMPNVNYDDICYSDAELYDSLYESFT